jgi:putative endonuclease
MSYYVYIIQSLQDKSYYKGFTENPMQRLAAHNNGESFYTSIKMPWELVCLLCYPSKKEALIKEKKLKKYSSKSIGSLILSNQNILSVFWMVRLLPCHPYKV